MALKHFTPEDWSIRNDRYWATFFNTLSGPRSAVMIGTEDEQRVGNIGLFNSLVHLGANPPLLGFILRPTTVARHTHDNLLKSGCYTINHGSTDTYKAAHQTSAKYESHEDEFELCGWKKHYIQGFSAPFIADAPIQIGMRYVSEYHIKENDTRLIVGSIVHVLINEDLIGADGFIDTAAAKSLLSCGLDAYHKHELIERLPYARP